MSTLPDYRRAIHGRTYNTPHRHSDYAGIEHHPSVPPIERAAGVVLAFVIGLLLAMALVHWWLA